MSYIIIIILQNTTGIEGFLISVRQWRHSHMAMKFLIMLVRHDYPLPINGVKLIVNCLINDSLAIRKVRAFFPNSVNYSW